MQIPHRLGTTTSILAITAAVALTAAPAAPPDPPGHTLACEARVQAEGPEGREVWLEVCAPYTVRAGGQELHPRESVVVRETSRGRELARITVEEGQGSVTTEVSHSGREHPDGRERTVEHLAVVEFPDGGGMFVRTGGGSGVWG